MASLRQWPSLPLPRGGGRFGSDVRGLYRPPLRSRSLRDSGGMPIEPRARRHHGRRQATDRLARHESAAARDGIRRRTTHQGAESGQQSPLPGLQCATRVERTPGRDHPGSALELSPESDASCATGGLIPWRPDLEILPGGFKCGSPWQAKASSQPRRSSNPPTIGNKFPTTALLALGEVPSLASQPRCAHCPQ